MFIGNKLIFTEREKLLIVNSLYILECLCFAHETEPDIERDLNGTPDPDEIRTLMNKVENK